MQPLLVSPVTAAQELDVGAVLLPLAVLPAWCGEWLLWRKGGWNLLAVGVSGLPLPPHSFPNVFRTPSV